MGLSPSFQRGVGVGFHDRFEAVQLFLLFRQDIDLVSLFLMAPDVLRQEVELLVEDRLRQGVEGYLAVVREITLLPYLYRPAPRHR